MVWTCNFESDLLVAANNDRGILTMLQSHRNGHHHPLSPLLLHCTKLTTINNQSHVAASRETEMEVASVQYESASVCLYWEDMPIYWAMADTPLFLCLSWVTSWQWAGSWWAVVTPPSHWHHLTTLITQFRIQPSHPFIRHSLPSRSLLGNTSLTQQRWAKGHLSPLQYPLFLVLCWVCSKCCPVVIFKFW